MTYSDTGYDAELVRLEHDSFVFLQHVYTMSEGDPGARLMASRMTEDLGFPREQGVLLLDHLIAAGCLAGQGPAISITHEGIDYIERLAWRRRSVRACGPGGWPDLTKGSAGSDA